MTSLFYGLSALLMAAAHYTLCDETSVVEASTWVSMWGDLAAGWLLANHRPLAGLVLTGTTVFSMWVVMSVLQRMDESDVDSKEPLSRCASQSSNRDANAEEEKVELYTYPPSVQCHYVAVADSVLMAAPAETDMSLTGPYNSGSIAVDPLMRSYMGGDPYRRAKMAAAAAAAALQVAAQTDLEDGEVSMELEDGEMSPTEIRLHDFNCRYAEINQMKRKLFNEYPEIADQLDRPASRPRTA